MPFRTFVPDDEYARPQRDALQQFLAGLQPPGLAQAGSMLQEHLRSLGTVAPAARGAADLMDVFGRLGPVVGQANARATGALNAAGAAPGGLEPADVVNPLRGATRAGMAATEPATEALAPAGSALDRFQQEQRRPLDTTLQALRLPGETPEQAATEGRKWLEAGEALAGSGPIARAAGVRGAATGLADELAIAKRNLQQWGYEIRPNGGGQWTMPDGTGVGVSAKGGIMNHWEVARDAGYLPQSTGPRGQLIGDANPINAGLMQKGWIRNTGSSGSPAYEFWQADGPTRRLLEKELDFARPDSTAYLTAAGEGVTYRFRVQDFLDNNGDLGRTLARAVKDEHGALPARPLPSLTAQAEEAAPTVRTGIQRGARGRRLAPLSPEEQAARAADIRAEEGTFSAIQALWKQGLSDEADDLRLLAMGKGRQGLAAVRDYFTERGLDLDPIRRFLVEEEGSVRLPQHLRLPTAGEVADVATSAPLLRPTSLINNAVSGGFRTAQRWLEESAGAAAVDRSLRESIDDLGAMAAEVPAALRQFGQTFRQGGTPSTRSQLGAGAGSLVTDPSTRAQFLTAGTRLNVATDEFWRTINEAGAIARAQTRGLSTADAAAKGADAADFVSFAGKASRLADYLGGYRRVLNDPDASGPAKAFAAAMVSVTPYVKTPERVLLATGRLLGDPVALPLSALSKNSTVRAALRGDPEAKREVAGRLLVSGMTYLTALGAYASGQLHGPPPKDAKLRRQLEAEGAQWNTLLGVPLRTLGVFGQAMSGLAAALGQAERTAAKGADPSDVLRSFFSEAARWALEDSYLKGLSDFDRAVREGRGAQEVERLAADAATRPLSGLSGFADPFDPYEREKRGTGAELLEGLPGGRFALPTKVDPATGEPVRREGSGLERLLLGSRGTAESPEARELARLGVTAREFKPQEKAFGQLQTPEARRALQETYGRYARDYIRDTMARPDYKGASDEEKAATLARQLNLAETLASIEVGDRVARDPQARFELEWLRTPQYRGVEGNPTQVARQNLEIREAKALLSEYQRRYGETPGRYRFYEEHPDLIDAARRPEIPARALAEEREAVRRRTGAPDTRNEALVGAGNRVVPTPSRSPAFTAP